METNIPVENDNITLRCHVIFASIDFTTYEPKVFYVDSDNVELPGNQTNDGKLLTIWYDRDFSINFPLEVSYNSINVHWHSIWKHTNFQSQPTEFIM